MPTEVSRARTLHSVCLSVTAGECAAAQRQGGKSRKGPRGDLHLEEALFKLVDAELELLPPCIHVIEELLGLGKLLL